MTNGIPSEWSQLRWAVIQIKVKCVPVHVMKKRDGNWVIIPCILKLGTRWTWVVSFMSWPLNSWTKSSHCPLIFCTCPDWPWGPPSLLYNGYWVSFFPGVKQPKCGIDHRTISSSKVKERVELHLYFPSGSSQPVLGWILPYHFLLTPSSTAVTIFCPFYSEKFMMLLL
jgi:hypothetical protein